MPLLLHIPAFLSHCLQSCPPPLASPYGFSMAAAAREYALRRRKAATGWRGVKGAKGRGENSSTQASGAYPQLPRLGSERAQWVGRKWARRADLLLCSPSPTAHGFAQRPTAA